MKTRCSPAGGARARGPHPDWPGGSGNRAGCTRVGCRRGLLPRRCTSDSHLFVTSLGGLLPNLGVAVYAHAVATGLLMNDRDQVDVATDHGVFECRDLVIAAGSWTPKLTRLLGQRLPIQPGKGYSVTIPTSMLPQGTQCSAILWDRSLAS